MYVGDPSSVELGSPTYIFPRIKEVDLFNSLKLKELTGNMFISKTMYVGDPSSVEKNERRLSYSGSSRN